MASLTNHLSVYAEESWQNPLSGSAENEVAASPKVSRVSIISLCCNPDIGMHLCLGKPAARPVRCEPELIQLSTVLLRIKQGAKMLSLWHD